MRCGFSRLKIDLKPSVSFTLHEIRDISPTHCDDDLQISSPCLRGVYTERNGFSNDPISNVRHGYSIGIVGFYEERTSFYVPRR